MTFCAQLFTPAERSVKSLRYFLAEHRLTVTGFNGIYSDKPVLVVAGNLVLPTFTTKAISRSTKNNRVVSIENQKIRF